MVTKEEVDNAKAAYYAAYAATWRARYAAARDADAEAAAAVKAADAVIDTAWLKYKKLKEVYKDAN